MSRADPLRLMRYADVERWLPAGLRTWDRGTLWFACEGRYALWRLSEARTTRPRFWCYDSLFGPSKTSGCFEANGPAEAAAALSAAIGRPVELADDAPGGEP